MASSPSSSSENIASRAVQPPQTQVPTSAAINSDGNGQQAPTPALPDSVGAMPLPGTPTITIQVECELWTGRQYATIPRGITVLQAKAHLVQRFPKLAQLPAGWWIKYAGKALDDHAIFEDARMAVMSVIAIKTGPRPVVPPYALAALLHAAPLAVPVPVLPTATAAVPVPSAPVVATAPTV
jgi:hypothetical protein